MNEGNQIVNLYEILGINSNATGEEIKHAYRRQAMRWHPDRNPGIKQEAERRFKEFGYAYSVLSDPVKRRAYDDALRNQESAADDSEFSDEKAFSIFLATVLDMAFELALQGAESITIFRTLMAEGCPEAIAQTVAQRAYTMAQRSSPKGAKPSADGRTHKTQSSPPKRPPPSTPAQESETNRVSPWRRFWAKLFDFFFVGIVTAPLGYFALTSASISSGFNLLLALFIYLLLPFLLIGILGGILGNTPGKSMLAISVRKDGKDPTTSEYVMRELSVWLRGFWCGIPFVCLIPQFLAFRAIRTHGRRTSWDERGGFDVVPIREGKARIFAFVASLIALALVSSLVLESVTKSGVGQIDPPQAALRTSSNKETQSPQNAQVENKHINNFLEVARPLTDSEVLRSQGVGGNQDLDAVKAWGDAQLSARSIGREDRQDAHNLARMWQRQIITKLGHSPERSLFLGYSVILAEFDDSRHLCRPDIKREGGVVPLENGKFSTFMECRQL